MPEDALVRNCAPTLAGLKTANLFTCPCQDRNALLASIRAWNFRLRAKGLRLIPLRFSQEKALIYLYRPARLAADLADGQAVAILRDCGYPDDPRCCVGELMRKLRTQSDFPHEIGLFLGYPPEDVRGFICNQACHCKCVGCWKVYGDEVAARKKFAQYKKCTRIYCDQWAKGKDIERLAVAG